MTNAHGRGPSGLQRTSLIWSFLFCFPLWLSSGQIELDQLLGWSISPSCVGHSPFSVLSLVNVCSFALLISCVVELGFPGGSYSSRCTRNASYAFSSTVFAFSKSCSIFGMDLAACCWMGLVIGSGASLTETSMEIVVLESRFVQILFKYCDIQQPDSTCLPLLLWGWTPWCPCRIDSLFACLVNGNSSKGVLVAHLDWESSFWLVFFEVSHPREICRQVPKIVQVSVRKAPRNHLSDGW